MQLTLERLSAWALSEVRHFDRHLYPFSLTPIHPKAPENSTPLCATSLDILFEDGFQGVPACHFSKSPKIRIYITFPRGREETRNYTSCLAALEPYNQPKPARAPTIPSVPIPHPPCTALLLIPPSFPRSLYCPSRLFLRHHPRVSKAPRWTLLPFRDNDHHIERPVYPQTSSKSTSGGRKTRGRRFSEGVGYSPRISRIQ